MKHGEIWLVDFAPKIGQEIDKKRPAIIVNHDSMGVLQLKVVVPVTDVGNTIKDWHIKLSPNSNNGLRKECAADCFQVKSISKERFLMRLGVLSQNEIDEVKLGLMKVLDLF
ncbi:MAG: type II toxin-antitoxin system PemK/MazF family toxin [Algoriphagus sp.]|uniref:type II toxin-antitoxin system PemK/MazF family toxin n=1 Tax=Algoriphagus sp. TaxID=1872435 RepID=UPI002730AE83|nr:type II toxin-antitoxin system PemK/MazF family toxin [Algoriphagus sp.]MDP2040351.1 type II toxin-antitoxin system PemK/MazF family toxin [Algoriphagus sp.]MDP3473846.1 type II toxin-antitoxin system PemK/MazF family toxin [Algoriphagus sp.]